MGLHKRIQKGFSRFFRDVEREQFVDLTPVDNADPTKCYTKALSFAVNNPRIYNIALTGPYGSGKSSIIRTFEKNCNSKFLNISLASFKEVSDNNVSPSLIERSILQQMLYGADANKLPYSRFKRISTPEQPLLKSILIVLWAVVFVCLFRAQHELVNIQLFSLSGLIGITLIAFSISLPIVIVSDIYKASFGLSLKKFSLKNAEIETSEQSENSILNRHLDEIIYFFQVTDYNVVVVEDLDRFGNPEIFVKLREINKLINDNDKTISQIKFLYALKDDMFAHKNRTKFFDFIIPVVPIINSSNSLDKMQERLREVPFERNIDLQFLREVSLYIDDLRLIHNIFNEFIIYYEQLKSDSLNVVKLLAMMIYKNVYPSDFELLHHNEGSLFRICKKKHELIKNYKEDLKEKLAAKKETIEIINSENARDTQELINVYVGHISMYADRTIFGIVCGGVHVGFSQFNSFENFEPLLSEGDIQLALHPNANPNHRFPIGKSFSQVEEIINPGETFLSRKDTINKKFRNRKGELQSEIRNLEKEIDDVSQLTLSRLIQNSDIDFEKLFSESKMIDGGLLIYLVSNGYLDDNYHIYMSTFHEGRLTKNDRDYLLTIRNFSKPDPNQNIDNPKEICENMRVEDFGYKYVLNVKLIDYLIENKEFNLNRIEMVMRYLSQNYKRSEEFLNAYFITGENVSELILSLSHAWPSFASEAVNSITAAEQISYILNFVEPEFIKNKMNSDNSITSYLSKHGALVLASELKVPNGFDFLKHLNVRFEKLPTIERNEALVNFAIKNCLYTITVENVIYILRYKSGLKSAGDTNEFETQNYTAILSIGGSELQSYIELNILDYVENVFLSISNNSHEISSTIKKLINNNKIQQRQKELIISKQDHIFDDFYEVPESLWLFLMSENKVSISWKNISSYVNYDGCDIDALTEYVMCEEVVEKLSTSDISIKEIGKEKSLKLSNFIINNSNIIDSVYCRLVDKLPYLYSRFPPNLSNEKLICLAKCKKVKLTDESFNLTKGNDYLQTMLISKSFDEYLRNKEIYPITNGVRELLLSSDISYKCKMSIMFDVSPSDVIENNSLASEIASLLIVNEVSLSSIDDVVLSSAVINAKSLLDSVKLLIKCLKNWQREKILDVISQLPEPYSEIANYGKRPRLNYNEDNILLVKNLEEKGVISSYSCKFSSIIVNTYKSSKH